MGLRRGLIMPNQDYYRKEKEMNNSRILICILIIFTITKMSYSQNGWALSSNPIAPGYTNDLGKIQFVSSTEGWVSAPNGQLLHSTDAGITWTIVTPFPGDTVSSTADPSVAMWWVNSTHGWKMNFLGTDFSDAHGAVLQQTTDGGATWTKKVLSTTAGDAGFEVQFADENNGWALIYNFSSGIAKFLRTTDGGNNWNPFNGVGMFYFVDANNGWAIGASGAQGVNPPYYISHTTNGGTDWTEQYSDSTGNFNAIQFTDANNGWVVGDSAVILKTTDGGNNWTKVTNTGIYSSSNSKCVFFIDGNTGWVGTNDGIQDDNPNRVILHTTNGGASWTKEYPPISNAVFSIFFRDGSNGWFTAGNCVQNCSGPDSLKMWQGVIGHTNNGGVTGVGEEKKSVPSGYALLQNYPNPFNPSTIIKYSVPQRGIVTIKVYDNSGKEITTLVNEEKQAGDYSVEFSASGGNTGKLASGIYYYKMRAGSFSDTKKLILLK